jgi:hypothetical protein
MLVAKRFLTIWLCAGVLAATVYMGHTFWFLANLHRIRVPETPPVIPQLNWFLGMLQPVSLTFAVLILPALFARIWIVSRSKKGTPTHATNNIRGRSSAKVGDPIAKPWFAFWMNWFGVVFLLLTIVISLCVGLLSSGLSYPGTYELFYPVCLPFEQGRPWGLAMKLHDCYLRLDLYTLNILAKFLASLTVFITPALLVAALRRLWARSSVAS